ncbi:putative peptidoglycan biosynthesis protein MurJ [Pelotomaculum schinkii]|uniref:Probable lipid II flippase MurJ n=1 Tax=Pelotomaculum schinkii TaxID=78350 RepID=A0A4Y7R6B6_9FIRM|nr:murein biosynthesis integral membrane protein MurJ [Pelotomaculum schinkii]TEB04293.1 putative peptidoglycan biosynthesis protein MurJ [Pelotomaculum schinkii]
MTTGRFIFKATLLLAFFSLMSKVLGLVRDIVIANQFGTSMPYDCYQIAIKMPNMLFTIVSGALATVIVPVFVEYAGKGRRNEAWKIFNTVMVVVSLFYLAASLVGILGAPLLVKLLAPGYQGEQWRLIVELLRILLPLMVFTGLASLFTGLLNANNTFGLPAFSTSVNNILIIIFTLTLYSFYGIYGLALGTVLAAVGMALVQLPVLFKSGFRLNLDIDLKHPGVRQVYYLALPSVLGITINQAPILINVVLGTWLPEGSLSALSYADRLNQFPLGLFGMALSTAVFPTLSARAAGGDRDGVAVVLANSLKAVALITVPASVGLMVLSKPIVSLTFERGAFNQGSAEITSAAVFFYAIGLLGQAGVFLLTRVFYSLQDTRTPVKIAVVAVLLNLVMSLILIKPLQLGGLALASSLYSLANMTLLMVFLGKKLPGLYHNGLLKFGLAVLVSAGLMAAATYAANRALDGWLSGTAGLVLQVGLAGAAGLAVYLAAVLLLGAREVRYFWRTARGSRADS